MVKLTRPMYLGNCFGFYILNIVENTKKERERRWRAVTDVKGENPSEKGQNKETLTGFILFKVTSSIYIYI